MNKKGQSTQILGNFILLIIFVVITFAAGLAAGALYLGLNTLEATLLTIDFPLPIQNNVTGSNVTDFQDILEIVVYPILAIKESLPYLTYFLVFALIISMAITAYVGSKNPVFLVLHILFLLVVSYFCIILSNTYQEILSNPIMNAMMLNFVIYNKVMLYLPQILFFTGLLFGIIAFINLIKPQTNYSATGLNYGGDY